MEIRLSLFPMTFRKFLTNPIQSQSLRDGVYIDTVKSADVNEDDLKKLMVGREVTGDYYRSDYGEKVSDEVVLSVKNVTVPGLIEDIKL